MKCLFLSTITGQGHNSAATAIMEYLGTRNCESVFLDSLKLGKRDFSRLASDFYVGLVLHVPRLFRVLYRLGERVSSDKKRSPVFYINSLYADKLYKEILRIQPDVIACTHIYSAQTVTRIREKYGLKLPAIAVATDYTCSPFWEETRLDGYVIPSPALIDEFAEKGIPREKLLPFGIPVSSQFRERLPKQAAREKFGFTAKHVFVVMGGSMGYGDLRGLAVELLTAVPDSQIAVLCGTNKTLYQQMAGLINIFPFEYTNHVGALMDTADVFLTKPGGLSSTESFVKRVPTILTCPIPGCELRNVEYLVSIGAAVYAGSNKEAAREARRLVSDPSAVAGMLKAQDTYIRRDADREIGEYLLKLASRKETREKNA